jgi:hypothetical protein
MSDLLCGIETFEFGRSKGIASEECEWKSEKDGARADGT